MALRRVATQPCGWMARSCLALNSHQTITSAWSCGSVRHATSKAGGSTKNGRDSQPKYLGVKVYGEQFVQAGDIIVRQRGQRYGIVDSTQTVAFGKDWTIYALKPGFVKFWYHTMKKKYFVEVLPVPAGYKASPGEEEVIPKYPIVRVKQWEIPDLLKLPADTPVGEKVADALLTYLRSVHPAHLRSILPPGKKIIGNVHEHFWKDEKLQSTAPSGAVGGAAAVTPSLA